VLDDVAVGVDGVPAGDGVAVGVWVAVGERVLVIVVDDAVVVEDDGDGVAVVAGGEDVKTDVGVEPVVVVALGLASVLALVVPVASVEVVPVVLVEPPHPARATRQTRARTENDRRMDSFEWILTRSAIKMRPREQ